MTDTKRRTILWVVNLMLPALARLRGLSASVREGWLSGLYDAFKGDNRAGIRLAIAYPVTPGSGGALKRELDGVLWYGFYEDISRPERYDAGMEARFSEIIADCRPDILHIFGTEFPHALAAARSFGRPERTLIGIQGLCFSIADNYMAGLPDEIQRRATIRDVIKRDSLRQQREKFYRRAEHEREAIKAAGHITGRTDYDRKGAAEINSEAVYHLMNETLRKEFYTGEPWSAKNAAEHSIFMSQGDIPLKGFHHAIEALNLLKEDYPDVTLSVAGNSVVGGGGGMKLPPWLKVGEYGAYLRSLISKYRLAGRLKLVGSLDAAGMRAELLRAHVFICPSVIENSPNSLGEAMLLGIPSVASRTGGIPSMMTDGREGVLTEPGDPSALAAGIKQIFDEPVIAGLYGENARARALSDHDPEKNISRLFEIYDEIAE